ncbi:synaptotagmin-like protein 2 [Emydura macquarii macquarii]|uniref:synaptotagmin-like protein 2 n=1 Tax=Emydura macquarii macquarii TaxID=1129001 RepID=UPI00352B1BA5
MLDLSFLTEEEYEKLMKVLQRDAELKKKDGDRIRRLQGSLKDEKKKKFVTGEWFNEVKAKRFQEELAGPDLLRASIKRKKEKPENETNEHVRQSLEGRAASLPSEATSPLFPELSPDLGDERSNTTVFDSSKGYKTRPKPKPRLFILPSSSIERSSVSDISPAESNTGISPFLATTDNWQVSEKGHEVHPSPGKLSEEDMLQSSYSSGVEVPDVASGTPATQKASPEDTNISSKIPVKRKASKGLVRSEALVNHTEQTEGSHTQRESLKSSKLLSGEEENNWTLKQGANYTISSMSNKEEETGLDHEHFKNLRNFWEKGADTVVASNVSEESFEKPSLMESNGRPFTVSRSLSVQSNQSQNGEEKSNVSMKTRIPYKRTVTLSSSEDEPCYVAHPRKGSNSSLPRSTYSKSKGAVVTRNSPSESNGRQEEERKAQRCLRKSKLPVRMPSIKIQSPSTEEPSSTFEPETPADEYIMAEESRRKVDSLASRVQILIDPAYSDSDSDRDKRSDLGIQDNMETNGELPKTREPADNLMHSEPAMEREAIQGTDSAIFSEEDEDQSPVAMALARANSINLAKSMVNIYTTSDTYNKPQITHQLLEPDRAKELSRSTPVLLSETESDTASEISFQFNRHRKTPSIGSHSSDMASVSSVSGSVLSVYSGDFGSVDAQGTVQFALDYDEKNREFQIYVSQCKDLAVVDERKSRSDPYVKTYLLPDKARMGKRKTSVKKRTVNPVYNEVLRYKIEKMVLLIQKLNLSVWHNDPLGRNSFLGEIEIDLASWDWSNKKLNWYMLKPRSLSATNGVDHRGVMNLSIKYVPPGSLGPKNPSSGEVHIWVKDSKDLLQLRPSGVDSFVKCYVLPDTSKKSYQKTRVIKRDPNPVFNHTIVYDGFHTEDLKDACVELTVWDHEKLTNHFLGGIRLGLGTGTSYGIPVDWMDSTQEEVAFWQEMMSASNEWIEGSLPLRSLAGRRKLK